VELRLTFQPPAGRSRDLLVDVDPGVAVKSFIDALAGEVGVPPRDIAGALLVRKDRRVPPDAPVGSADLRDGDVLALELADPDAPTYTPTSQIGGDGALIDLVVMGGPLMGTRVGLRPGSYVVGRGPGADVVLADGSLSRRHLEVAVSPDAVEVRDLGSSNGTFLEGVALTAPRALREGEAVELGRSLVVFERRRPGGDERRGDGRGGVPFNRPPRVARPDPRRAFALPAPPAESQPVRVPLGAAFIPLGLAAAMWAITGSPLMLMVGLLTPAMAMYNAWESRRRGRTERGDAVAAFRAQLDEVVADLAAARAAEAADRQAGAPGAEVLRARAERLEPSLWERRPDDPDFLELRVGVADLPADSRAQLERGGDAELREEAEQRLGGGMLTSMPVVAPAAGLGLAGAPERVAGLARWLVAQAAVLHSPAEASIAAALSSRTAREWDWLKWLPHAREPGLLAVGEDAARTLIEQLARGPDRDVLLVLDGGLALDRALVAEAFRDRVHVVWLGGDPRELPGACRTIAELDPDIARLRITRVESGATLDDVAADGVTREWTQGLARLLAPVRDVGARDARASVPDRVSLLDVLDVPEPTARALAAAWQDGGRSLSAPIGMTADGPFEVDPGRTDGLRGLIGGMPGAGKSELLQALVASLAARHPPDRLAFLLVDYKGGAAFKDCVELPHVVGLVTDLDVHLAERARVSLMAELRRREGILADAGARDLGELTRRDPGAAPPAVLIVVDEFATLAREVPAFVETMVDVAQRGRSLGLHLVLATQRPRGVVNDTIRANTNLRIAMRMSDGAESADVIEAPDAAEIPAARPGRALALTGRGPGGAPELTAFQAAYAGGRSAALGESEVRVANFALGAGPERRERVLSLTGTGAPTDLQAIVTAAGAAAERLEIARPPSPWLPPLPARVALEVAGPRDGAAVIGLTDEPEHQRQESCVVDLDRDGSVLVYGTSGSGKTTLLQTLAASMAMYAGPRELNLYCLDFASRGLAPLEALPHCGSVIAGDDDERVMRLLAVLQRTIAHRRDAFASHGTASLADYRLVPGAAPVARIVVLLDGYAGFASAYERVSFGDAVSALHRIVAEGRPLGVHLVATADRRASVPGALSGVATGRLVLRMADEDDYAGLGVPRSAIAGASLPPGRGFTREAREFQTAVLGDDQGAAIADLGARLSERYPGERAPSIGILPTTVPRTRMPRPAAELGAVVGVGNETLRPVAADLRDDHFLVAGPLRSGRSTALVTLAGSLRQGTRALELHLLAPRRSPLAALPGWASMTQGTEQCRAACDALLPLLDRPPGAPPVVVVIDDGAELSEALALETLVRRGRDAGVRVLAAVETAAALRAFGGWLREIRNGRRGLLLAADLETDGDLLGVRLPRSSPVPPAPGRGYLVAAGAAELVQVASD
jgi:S-DNA-T family DNA segregation ATPase FtsK/SpoIIIE